MTKVLLFMKGFKKGFKEFTDCIVALVNTILLIFVYVFGVGISSVLAKIIGKNFMDVKTSKKTQDSYWKDFSLSKEPTENYYRQF